MSEVKLWNAYTDAMVRFDAAPRDCRLEGEVIATFAEWARSAYPDDADELVSLLCRRLAERNKRPRRAP